MISEKLPSTVRLVQAAVILSLLLVAALAQTQARVKRAATPSKEFASLPQLMREGIHEQFTFISFAIYHDSPMTEKKLNSLAKSASNLQQLATHIPGFKASYFRNYAGEDLALVDSAAADLETVAHSLSLAAANKDEKSLEPLLTKLEASCDRCHSKFKQELTFQNVEPTQPKK